MIGWLRGRPMECWTQGNRSGILLACGDIGYEVQVITRQQQNLAVSSSVELWIHQVQREDATNLYGFINRVERDLFRQLIGVNGVGPQAGMALLQECTSPELIEAIRGGDLRRLCRAQGIGKRTAERLAVELRTSVDGIGDINVKPSLVDGGDQQFTTEVKDLQETLLSLGYEDLEIRRAVKALREGQDAPEDHDSEGWIRACLQWLNQA
ncbi:MAG: Holliday junction branch migration protein RuvA [Synechococcus sp. TMED20]|nr:MAG: Holliday junction branch migration protein RuvA [Synechococcus sp. TMED20]